VKTPADLDKVAALIAEHGTSGGTE